MDAFRIEGGARLVGEVRISGSKNAVLPILCATILAPGTYRIGNVPVLRDVVTLTTLLRTLGVRVAREGETLVVDSSRVVPNEAPYDLVRTMRASVYVLGPLLARFGHARVSLPGGCAWGPRPIDFHLKAMEALGAAIRLDHGVIDASGAPLRGAEIRFPFSSVGATGNAVMAAVLAEGRTTIYNVAREPEIVSLCEFLQLMGATIDGIGSEKLVIDGKPELHPADASVIPDRIEAGTYLVAGALTSGDLVLKNAESAHLEAVIAVLREAGVEIAVSGSDIRVRSRGAFRPLQVETAPHPGFPTDMQAQLITLLMLAEGTSEVVETIFPDRFKHVPELCRLGGSIRVEGNRAIVTGVGGLTGAEVMASDLRASAALILAGLVATGTTGVSRIYHIDRGYERIEEKLSGVGARIWRVRQ
ncbi:MAG: UDP-N-acetylglucosamine 1-carboxyvinyltransferase [Candidatus Latescibacterota bacterium]|nr:MAG: UDP-N-acetylglucosamine 1-carboxyvinyltransferase [Candidatus Latescibacterota bacterium]